MQSRWPQKLISILLLVVYMEIIFLKQIRIYIQEDILKSIGLSAILCILCQKTGFKLKIQNYLYNLIWNIVPHKLFNYAKKYITNKE